MTMSTTIEPEVKVLAWHFAPNNWKLRFSKEPLEVGKTYEVEGPIELCKNGLHASLRPIDALDYYAAGVVVSRVEVWGEVLHVKDKLCGRYRKHLAIADATIVLHEFALRVYKDTIEQQLAAGWKPYHDDYLGEVEFKQAWLDKKKTKREMQIARKAALDMARLTLVESVRVENRVATRYIDDEAVRKKIKEAAIAAEEAKYNNWLEQMLTELLEIQS